jgi:hypothetical protein
VSFLTLFLLSYVFMFGADVANSWWLMVWSGASEAPPCPGADGSSGNAALFYSDSFNEGQLNPSPFIATIMSLPSVVPVEIMGGETSSPVDVMYYIKFYALFGLSRPALIVRISHDGCEQFQFIHSIGSWDKSCSEFALQFAQVCSWGSDAV